MLVHKQQRQSLTGGLGPSVINFADKHLSFKWNHLNRRINILNPDLNSLLPPWDGEIVAPRPIDLIASRFVN